MTKILCTWTYSRTVSFGGKQQQQQQKTHILPIRYTYFGTISRNRNDLNGVLAYSTVFSTLSVLSVSYINLFETRRNAALVIVYWCAFLKKTQTCLNQQRFVRNCQQQARLMCFLDIKACLNQQQFAKIFQQQARLSSDVFSWYKNMFKSTTICGGKNPARNRQGCLLIYFPDIKTCWSQKQFVKKCQQEARFSADVLSRNKSMFTSTTVCETLQATSKVVSLCVFLKQNHV